MGISNTEYLLYYTLKNTIQFVKDNISVIDDIFDDVNNDIRQRIKDFWTDTNIFVTIGYPRDANNIPEYVILLNQEMERDKFLGDSETEPYLSDGYTTVVLGETLTTDDNITYLVSNFPIVSNEYKVYRNGDIVSEDEYNIDLQSGEIVFFKKQKDTDTITADYTYYTQYIQTGQTYFTETYQIECWGSNSEVAVWLFGVAKYFLLYFRAKLADEHGFYIQELMGKDIEPIVEYQPQFVFRRTLVISTERANIWQKYYPALKNIYVNNDPIR